MQSGRRIFNTFLYGLIGMALVMCSSSTDALDELNLKGNWQRVGLADTAITVLQSGGEGLMVGTEQGLFKWNRQGISNLGLNDREIPGVIRLKDGGLLAGAMPSSYSPGDTTLFRLQNEKSSWDPFLNNFGGKSEATWIEVGPVAARPLSDTIFVVGGAPVARSLDGGNRWQPVSGRWGSGAFTLSTLFYVDPFHPGRVWIGGVTNLSQPSLWKINDYGEGDWINVGKNLSKISEAVTYDVMIHPEDSNLVLVGLTGTIGPSNKVEKSTDGGKSWRVVLEETGVLTFARSTRNSNVIYASGRDASTKLFFAASADFGETWVKEIFEEGPSVVTTNDLAVLTVDGKEVLFLGTNKGMYSYTFDK